MDALWVTLLPLVLGSAITPSYWMLEILLLRSDRGRTKAALFVAGFATVKLLQGLLLGLAVPSEGRGHLLGHGVSPVVPALLLAAGVLFVGMAFLYLLGPRDESSELPAWMALFGRLTPVKAFALAAGMLLASPKLWVFTLTAVVAVRDAGDGPAEEALTYLVFVVLALAPLLALLGVTVVRPAASTTLLERLHAWLVAHNRALMGGVALVLGIAMTAVGLSRLGS